MDLFKIKKKKVKEKSKVLHLNNIGEVLLVKSRKTKRITISVRPSKGVKVSLPFNCSYEQAENFLVTKIDWILEAIEKIEKQENKTTIFDENTTFKTQLHQLIIKPDLVDSIKINIKNGFINVYYPIGFDVKHEKIQKAIRFGIEKTWQFEAKMLLPKKVEQIAQKFDFTYTGLHIKNTKTRWGSCTYKNSINLTLHLIRLPERLMDYVIIHELVHTKVKNHGKEFWVMLNQLTDGKARQLAKEMKNYRITIY